MNLLVCNRSDWMQWLPQNLRERTEKLRGIEESLFQIEVNKFDIEFVTEGEEPPETTLRLITPNIVVSDQSRPKRFQNVGRVLVSEAERDGTEDVLRLSSSSCLFYSGGNRIVIYSVNLARSGKYLFRRRQASRWSFEILDGAAAA